MEVGSSWKVKQSYDSGTAEIKNQECAESENNTLHCLSLTIKTTPDRANNAHSLISQYKNIINFSI